MIDKEKLLSYEFFAMRCMRVWEKLLKARNSEFKAHSPKPKAQSQGAILFIIFLLSLSILSTGCGYTTKSTLPGYMKTIYVERFENNIDFTNESNRNIYLPLLETNVRTEIINRFQFDGNLKVSKTEKADIVLTGNLKHYQRDVLRYDENNEVLEYRVKIFVSLTLYDNHKQETIWSDPDFVGEATYFLSGAFASY